MAGKFDGLTDAQWEIISDYIPDVPYVFGRPHPQPRKLLNTIFYVLITGCRWCDVPVGPQWGKRSTAHEYLGKWKSDGTMDSLRRAMLELADLNGMIDWRRGSVDGSFSPG